MDTETNGCEPSNMIIEEELLSEAEEEAILALLNDLKDQEYISHEEFKKLYGLK